MRVRSEFSEGMYRNSTAGSLFNLTLFAGRAPVYKSDTYTERVCLSNRRGSEFTDLHTVSVIRKHLDAVSLLSLTPKLLDLSVGVRIVACWNGAICDRHRFPGTEDVQFFAQPHRNETDTAMKLKNGVLPL
jgi:hypothetical protein